MRFCRLRWRPLIGLAPLGARVLLNYITLLKEIMGAFK
jgi:hypothetical protein